MSESGSVDPTEPAPGWTFVEVDVTVRYQLPGDLTQRKLIYGTTDIRECVQVDLDVDAAAFFENADDIRLGAVGEVDADV